MMSDSVKGRIYCGISFLCIALCIGLITTVALSELSDGRKIAMHRPPEMKMADDIGRQEGAGVFITEEEIAAVITGCLPSELPLDEMSAQVYKDGTVILCGEADKERLISYLKSLGMDQGTLGLLKVGLPSEIELEVGLMCHMNDESTAIFCEIENITAAGKSIDDQMLPEGIKEMLASAISRLLPESDTYYMSAEFSDGGIWLLEE